GRADASAEDDAGPKEPFDPREDCEIVEERGELARAVSFSDESGFALTPGLTGFGVAYQSDNCGAISVLPVASLGDYPEPKTLFPNCETIAQGVSLLYHGEGYRLRWVDNASGSGELQSLQLPSSLALPANPERSTLTNNVVRELAPVQASFASNAYLAWISQAGAERSILLQGSAASEPRTLIAADAEYAPTRLALSQLGNSTGALAFVSEAKKPGVYLLPLTAEGEPRGEPMQLTAAVSAGNTVDIATRAEDGGAVIYSLNLGERREIRFRRLSTDGELISDEIKVVSFPLEGRDASISRLGGGYVVAFRSLLADDPNRAEVRVTFLTKEGNLQRDSAGNVASYVIAETSATGGRLTARVSQDGQLLVGFLDTSAGDQGAQFRLIRKRLECAL
ncbi:MAG TPA: hypothetical protein VMF89_29160, partial [Polyangiales bacterium]|nr:hypothetical protein [Polyangiales bacterium]